MMPEPAAPLCIRAALTAQEALALRRQLCDAADRLPPDHADLQPTSASVRLRALGDACLPQLLQRLIDGPLGRPLHGLRPPPLALLMGQCWLRRQHAPALRPQGQHPHQWHQDGALGCRFHGGDSPEPLAPLLTAWVALAPCGQDAPSLEWITAAPDAVLPPAELGDGALLHRFGRAARAHAVLEPGDALLFGGALLHRTHVTPAMRAGRASVELRWALAPLPARLAAEPLASPFG